MSFLRFQSPGLFGLLRRHASAAPPRPRSRMRIPGCRPPRLLVLGLLVAAVSAVAAPDAVPEMSRVPRQTDRAAWNQYVREGWDSPFGLDYVFALNREFRKPDLARQRVLQRAVLGRQR